jgi:hypothetical protein
MSLPRGRPKLGGLRNEVLVICKRDRRVSISRLSTLLRYSEEVLAPIVAELCEDGEIRMVGTTYAWVPESGLDRLAACWPPLIRG